MLSSQVMLRPDNTAAEEVQLTVFVSPLFYLFSNIQQTKALIPSIPPIVVSTSHPEVS